VASAADRAIEASGLTKDFASTRAVDGLDLTVDKGSVCGFLGPNGAGKTTTIRMLATLLRPDRGTATVLGHDVVREADAVRSRVSLTGQFATVDDDLTGFENLVLLGLLLGHGRTRAKARADELLDSFGLTAAAGRPVKTYSAGIRHRLDVAASIIVTPDVLFLDEPTTGLDPRSRSEVWDIIRAIAAGGTTVLLTTQYLDEADRLADRVAVIDRGKLIAEGTSGELKASVGAGVLRIRLLEPGQRSKAEELLARALDVPVHAESDPAVLAARIPTTDSAPATSDRAASAVQGLCRSDVAVAEFALGQPSLDEVFLALTGHTSADEEKAS
jgi:ABC-2 type transport system ATP-binding protein